MKAVVICGGVGARLRPISYYLQKAMIPIGRREKPLLEYIIRLLSHHNFKEMLMLADYKAEQISNYFGDGSRFRVRITYLTDNPDLKGSLGALLNAHAKGLIKSDENFLVYYGDIISNINLTELIRTHEEKHATATLALNERYPVSVGVARIEGARIVEFTEKPDLGRPVSIGMLALNGRVLSAQRPNQGEKELDVMGNLIPNLIRGGDAVYPYLTDAFWYDVGSLEKYEKLSNDLIEEKMGFLFQS